MKQNITYERHFKPPKTQSFFLFGPRGTGKTTWLKQVFNPTVFVNLLHSEEYLQLFENPSLLRARLRALRGKQRVVIDEVQRIPDLLNEVHSLLEEFPDRFQFALTGSSARQLKKKGVNLLAGRAVTRNFFPFTSIEIASRFDLESSLRFGNLPKTVTTKEESEKLDFLYSYVETYLKEEIQQEALVRNLTSYNKFLKHLAIMNGHVLNLSNLSKEAGISRAPLENYMSIIQDTLLGVVIEPIHLKAKIKEVSTPKFYFFDTGVVRALTGELGDELNSNASGLFETLVLHEIRSASSYLTKRIEVYYWGTPSQNEVDFILVKGNKRIGIEVKYSKKWRSEFTKGLNVLLGEKKISSAFVVYAGIHEEVHGDVKLLPFLKFVEQLYAGKII